ncbi:MAG: aminotransferase class I/II-fold pyridoxal phosphate-dependent enzyme [Phycisphaerales bacterium]
MNPHAPSGRYESIDRLRQIAEEFNGVLMVDEAYVDFARLDASELAAVRTGWRTCCCFGR